MSNSLLLSLSTPHFWKRCPPGTNLEVDKCCEVRKGMHRKCKGALVEDDRIFCSEEVGFEKSEADQCLFHKR